MYQLDIHTHSIASGHGTSDQIWEMARTAQEKGLKLLAITDHGPATSGSAKTSYFQNLAFAPENRFGIQILYGTEANILDETGSLDLPNEVLAKLYPVIASIHQPTFNPTASNRLTNTEACIHAMRNPHVHILGHPDDEKFPLDYERLVPAAIEHHVLLELNNISLSPDGYRGDTKASDMTYLRLCMKYHYPIVLSSDSHGCDHIGDFSYASALLKELSFPKELILNYSASHFMDFFKK